MAARSPRGIKPAGVLANGKTNADAAADEQAKELEDLFEDDKVLDVERTKAFTGTGFSRMKMEWTGENRVKMNQIKTTVDGVILNRFQDAYAVMSDLYDVVREPEVDITTGEVKSDSFGFTIWKRSETGAYMEDWTRLTIRQRENFLYRITTSIFEWSQRSVDLWTEAMFAKALWAENFAIAFDQPMSGTIEDRTAVGNIKSADDRYFAIFLTALSRRAEAVVRSAELLGQRLKDGLE